MGDGESRREELAVCISNYNPWEMPKASESLESKV
jgi:hypothetical protein